MDLQKLLNLCNLLFTDVDECNADPCADNGATCTDTIGSYQCSCSEGYHGDGYENCFDVDECENPDEYCDMLATCSNTQGSYVCQCTQGYEGDGATCQGMIWTCTLLDILCKIITCKKMTNL